MTGRPLRVLIGCDERPCPRGSVGQRGPDGRCRCDLCAEVARERKRRWTAANPDRALAHAAKWRRENPEARSEAINRWRQANPEKVRKITLKAGAKWAKSRSEKRAAARALQRAKQISGVAPWADRAAMEAFYATAARLTKETGIPHEVDHIIPLTGTSVCGLHVETNLQVITKSANRRKGRKHHE